MPSSNRCCRARYAKAAASVGEETELKTGYAKPATN